MQFVRFGRPSKYLAAILRSTTYPVRASEDHALGAASLFAAAVARRLLIVIVARSLGVRPAVARGVWVLVVCASSRGRATCPLSSKLSYHVEEGGLHVDAVLRRCLHKFAAQLLRESAAFLCRHLSFRDTVALVSHKHDRSWTE